MAIRFRQMERPSGDEPATESSTSSQGKAGEVAEPLPTSSAVSGSLVARAILLRVDGGASSAGPGLQSALQAVIRAESQHELVALVGKSLAVRWDNYRAFSDGIIPTEPCMVVSLLGDTAVGKSTTIAELMGDAEERPHVQRGRDQSASTTFNVNFFPCRSLVDGLTINFLDFEGESGSEAPLMSGAAPKHSAVSAAAIASAARLFGLPHVVTSSPLARSEAVRECFPKLAYCISDVVIRAS